MPRSIDDEYEVKRDPLYGDNIQTDVITSKELVELTGMTYRQLDYWCRKGIIHAANDDMPGSGGRRYFSKDIVDRCKLLVRISDAFSRVNTPLHLIFDRYEDGAIEIGKGIYLTWDIVEIERER